MNKKRKLPKYVEEIADYILNQDCEADDFEFHPSKNHIYYKCYYVICGKAEADHLYKITKERYEQKYSHRLLDN